MWLKIILGLATVNILITPSHAAAANPNNFRDNCREKCYTDVCADEALRFIKLMDDQVDPCENFYDFVCGTYIRDTPLPDTDNEVSLTSDLQTAIADSVFSDLTEEIKDTDLNAFKKMKTYYQNCVNERRIEQTGLAPLQRILNSIGGWPVVLGHRWDERRFDLMQTVYKLREEKVPLFFPIMLTVDLDNLDSSKYAIKIANANMNVNAAWFAGDDRSKISKLFLEMLVKVACILGAWNDSDNTTQMEMQQVTDFEIDLFKISTPPEELVNLPVERSRTTIRELSRKYPSIPWLELINRILRPSVNEGEYVYVIDPDFIDKLVKLIARTPKRVLANFMAWKTVQNMMAYMPKVLNEASTDYENALDGSKGVTVKSSACYNEVQEIFTVGLSAMYIRNHFKDPIQGNIAEMAEIMKQEARKNLEQSEWMDDTTKRKALEKLEAMGLTIGHAKELADDRMVEQYYRELELNPGSYLESAFNMSFFTERMTIRQLRRTTDEDKWSSKQSVVELNAFNLFQENSIEIPAGFLNAFYKLGKPEFVNYGVVAAFLGHEIFHGFDNQGKQYDKHGNQVNWWTPESEEKFQQKAQCIIDQYSNFTVPGVNMNVNGELSQGENIADNGGFRVGYLAYKEWSRRHNIIEGCLPSLNYTPQQMFWISSASIMCAKEKPEYTRSSMTTDNHSPNIARIMVTFSNIKEFSDDFNCRLGSKMNPRKKCKVW